jgi:hypothetical protein
MLTKNDHITYWRQTANDSWQTAVYLYEGKRFADSLSILLSA